MRAPLSVVGDRAGLSHCGSSRASAVAVTLAQVDAVSLRQAIERAPVNAEQLGGELLVPARLAQHAMDMARHDSTKAERRAGSVKKKRRPNTLRRQILKTNNQTHHQHNNTLNNILQLPNI